ncbi:fimbrial protein [Serratia sp. JSRIV006]|uniref:fimbrial protein n=1 Tax=Serratia sp. JSRIV006 TaxID=2831896 RepID=UPI001CBFAEFD|nr:fimbrial protein [Serratia sp. JSRIV006]UAN65862.1 fimbrial protein [Serratia sp. JSRIV006]
MINLIKITAIIIVSMIYSPSSLALACFLDNNRINNIGGGGGQSFTAELYLNLNPTIGVNENVIIDLSSRLMCENETGSGWTDEFYIKQGSRLVDILGTLKAVMRYNGTPYDLPLNQDTPKTVLRNRGDSADLNVVLLLSQVNNAGGVIINSGDVIGEIILFASGSNSGANYDFYTVNWKIISNNNVIVPTGGCDVSARDVSVTLPAYDATSNQTFSVPLSVNCPSGNKNLSYFLSGTTADTAGKIFSNTSTSSPASGIGIQMLDQNNNAITVNNAVPLGTVGNTPVNLNLKATYAQTGAQVTAGNVQSVIGVTFTYP